MEGFERRPARRTAMLHARLLSFGLAALSAIVVPARAAEAPDDALNADSSSGAVKVCSPVSLPQWRSMVGVPRSWGFLDCMSFAGEMGANHFQLGCIFADVTPYAKKYAWGTLVRIDNAALAKPQPPVPNCGW